MKIKNILVGLLVGFVFSLLFGLWLVWFLANEQAAKKCGKDIEECRKAYCSACLTDYTCETYCKQFEE